MKKYIAGAALLTVLACTAEAKHDGLFAGVTAGYSTTSAKANTAITTVTYKATDIAGVVADTKSAKGGFNGSVYVGHGTKFGAGHFSAILSAAYDSSKAKIGTFTANAAVANVINAATASNIEYQPRFGLGLAIRGGAHFGENHKYLVFAKLGVDYNFAKTVLKTTYGSFTDSAKVWSFVPGIGVAGEINDRLNWTAGVDYKMAFSMSKVNAKIGANSGNLYKNKPRTFIVNAGLTYHF